MERTRSLLLVALAALALGAAPAGAHYRGIGTSCKPVLFEAQTDHVASAIHARGVSCHRARRLVRIWGEGRDRTPLGYRCRRRSHDPEASLAHSDTVCVNGTRRVSFAEY